jgi:hypothetical protein
MCRVQQRHFDVEWLQPIVRPSYDGELMEEFDAEALPADGPDNGSRRRVRLHHPHLECLSG